VTDTITRLPDASFAIILVDADAADFPTILGRIRLEVGSATEMFRTPPTWSAGAASYPKTASSSADLLRIAEELFARARREGGNSVYVAP
jgi:GGDEF domain-containing protein